MENTTVLITGANGHIGFRVLVFALQAGYKVKAAVRNQEKADRILAAPSVKAINPGKNLTFTFVPDLLQPGAYNEAVKDVDFAIHIASPITSGISEDKYETDLIQPAVTGTLGILKAAQSSPSIKRIVITSSVVAIIPWHDFFEAETGKTFNEHSRIPDPTGPYTNEFEAYAASKAIAFNATTKFMESNKLGFDVVHVHPSFVIGKDELVTSTDDILRGTNGAAFAQILGNKQAYPLPSGTVHIDDVALAHVNALDTSVVPGGFSLITQSEGIKGTNWGDAIEIVKRRFPKAVESGVLANDGVTPTKHVGIDAEETGRLLGVEFRGYEEQVVSVVGHYLELKGVEAA